MKHINQCKDVLLKYLHLLLISLLLFTISACQNSGNSIAETSDGGYVITGSKDVDIYLIKTNQNGNIQ